MDLKTILESRLADLTWNFVGILDTEKILHPIPKDINVQSLFEYLAKIRIAIIAKELKSSMVEAGNAREYPDVTLQGGQLGDKIIAVDIKTTRRRRGGRTISGFTLGSYAGYFRNPSRRMPGCRIPYGDFDEHWIVGFIYTWDKSADTLHMISNIELIVQPKWKIASRSTGTGTTTHIGSIRNINDLRVGRSTFKSEEEFYTYWRNY